MKYSRTIATLFSLALLSFPLWLPKLAHAQAGPDRPAGQEVTLPNPLGANVTPAELAGRIIRTLLGLSGALALVMFIYGGITFMLSGGNEARVTAAKNTLVYSALGLAIIFASYAILAFVLQVIGGATGS